MKTKNATPAQTAVSPNSESNKWRTRYRIAYNNQLPQFKMFADWYDVFYAVVKTKDYSLWRSKIYMPVLASKAWNLVAKFISLQPGFEVRVRDSGLDQEDLADDDQLEEKAEKMQLKLEYDYDNPKMSRPLREKLEAVLIDTVVTGTGLAKAPWSVCKETRYEHPVSTDGTIDMASEKVIETIEGYNDLIPVNIYNVFVAPTSTDLYSAPWIIIKDWKTIDQLKKINADKGVELYKNLDKLVEARSNGDELAVYKKSKNRLTTVEDPLIEDSTIDYIDIYECYELESNEIITFANAGGASSKEDTWVEIRRQKNPYWHGKYPLVRFVVKQRPHDFWGQSIFQTSHRLQVAINDVVNHYLDNWNLSVDGMLMAQESAGINDYIVEPGGLITYRTEEPKQFKFPEPNPASLNMVMSQLMQGIESDTISNYSTGDPSSDLDKTRGTKGGILAIQEAADDLTSFMRSNFQNSIKQLGQMWLSNNQQFMIRPVTVMTPKLDRLRKTVINPADLQGDMELRVDEASMLPISDDQMKAQFSAFTQQLMQFSQAALAQHNLLGTQPIAIDFNKVIEEAAEKFGFRNAMSFITEVPPGPSPAQISEMQQSQGGQQHPQEKIIEKMDYKDLPDDVKRQLEVQAGFKPSQTGVNSTAPHVQKANDSVHQMAQQLHAQGNLHPAVLDEIRGHLGIQPQAPADHATPIGPPPAPAPTGGNA
jgi:hypothetical protein